MLFNVDATVKDKSFSGSETAILLLNLHILLRQAWLQFQKDRKRSKHIQKQSSFTKLCIWIIQDSRYLTIAPMCPYSMYRILNLACIAYIILWMNERLRHGHFSNMLLVTLALSVFYWKLKKNEPRGIFADWFLGSNALKKSLQSCMLLLWWQWCTGADP